MEPFVKLNGVVAPLDRVNVDTDQIIPPYISRASSASDLANTSSSPGASRRTVLTTLTSC